MCAQVGRDGRSVSEVARDLGCDWHTVMDAVIAYGAPLIDDPARIGEVAALGLDETLFRRKGAFNTKEWATSIVDVNTPIQLIDMVEWRQRKMVTPPWPQMREGQFETQYSSPCSTKACTIS